MLIRPSNLFVTLAMGLALFFPPVTANIVFALGWIWFSYRAMTTRNKSDCLMSLVYVLVSFFVGLYVAYMALQAEYTFSRFETLYMGLFFVFIFARPALQSNKFLVVAAITTCLLAFIVPFGIGNDTSLLLGISNAIRRIAFVLYMRLDSLPQGGPRPPKRRKDKKKKKKESLIPGIAPA